MSRAALLDVSRRCVTAGLNHGATGSFMVLPVLLQQLTIERQRRREIHRKNLHGRLPTRPRDLDLPIDSTGSGAMPWRQEGLGASRGPKPSGPGMSPCRASGRLVLTAGGE